MKKALVTVAALVALSSNAFAADLRARPYTKAAPMMAPIYTWTGFYVGGNVGYGWGSNNVAVNSLPVQNFFGNANLMTLAATEGTGAFSGNDGSLVGGAQVGYNMQSGSMVAGVEADIQWMNQGRSYARFSSTTGGGAIPAPIDTNLFASQGLDWLGTARVRLGFTMTPSTLLYATGGLAYGEVKSSFAISQAHLGGAGLVTGANAGSFSEVRAGWTVGAGAEWALASNWSVKAEYLYYDLGSVNYPGGLLLATVPVNTPRYSISSSASADFTGNIARVGVNYRWGGSPVVAKY